jgi:hypothetical protein
VSQVQTGVSKFGTKAGFSGMKREARESNENARRSRAEERGAYALHRALSTQLNLFQASDIHVQAV